jgi:hypothetical protein
MAKEYNLKMRKERRERLPQTSKVLSLTLLPKVSEI